MLKTATIHFEPRAIRESMLAASRQLWLASLGAAAVTREWVQHEAGHTMKSLAREGAAVESHAVRFVGDRIEASVTRANSVLTYTRRVGSTAKRAADTTAALAARLLPKALPLLPRVLSRFELFGITTKPAAKRTKAKKSAPARKHRATAKTVRSGKTTKKSPR